MSDPGEAVAGKHRAEKPPGVPREQRQRKASQHQRGSDDVQAAAGPIAMLGQVERIELAERRIALGHRILRFVRYVFDVGYRTGLTFLSRVRRFQTQARERTIHCRAAGIAGATSRESGRSATTNVSADCLEEP